MHHKSFQFTLPYLKTHLTWSLHWLLLHQRHCADDEPTALHLAGNCRSTPSHPLLRSWADHPLFQTETSGLLEAAPGLHSLGSNTALGLCRGSQLLVNRWAPPHVPGCGANARAGAAGASEVDLLAFQTDRLGFFANPCSL